MKCFWKGFLKWFTNDKENVCERKRDLKEGFKMVTNGIENIFFKRKKGFWVWNISESKFKIILGLNIEYGNGNDLKDLKWEFKTVLKR